MNFLSRFRKKRRAHKRPDTNKPVSVEQLERRDLLTLTVDDVRLLNDTGLSDSDGVTYDPTLAGTINGLLTPGYTLTIEFDHNGDQVFDGSVSRASTGDFSYDPSQHLSPPEPGPVSIAYRAIESFDGQPIFMTSWGTFSFTLVDPPSVDGILLERFGLFKDTGESISDKTTVHPGIAFRLGGDFGGETAAIEFDLDQDGTAESHVASEGVGRAMYYDPRVDDSELVDYTGDVDLDYRVVKLDQNSAVVSAGSWESFNYTLEDPPASDFEISTLGLEHDTGVSAADGFTWNATIEGTVVDTDPSTLDLVQHVLIEFDHDGDDAIDGLVTTGDDDAFVYEPNLPYGDHTVRARPMQWSVDYGTYLRGPWESFDISIIAAPPVKVGELKLANDDGEDTDDSVTSDPYLVGQLYGPAFDPEDWNSPGIVGAQLRV